jgi:hypothetical protein
MVGRGSVVRLLLGATMQIVMQIVLGGGEGHGSLINTTTQGNLCAWDDGGGGGAMVDGLLR